MAKRNIHRKKTRSKSPPLLGPNYRKVHPKLRMYANGSQAVNEIRADFSSSIRIKEGVSVESESPIQNLDQLITQNIKKKTWLNNVTDKIEANVFIQKIGCSDKSHDPVTKRMKGGIADIKTKESPNRDIYSTVTVALSELSDLASDESVAWIEPGEPLKAPTPLISSESISGYSESERNFNSKGGEGVLIGIIDVQGFDFAHKDFLIENESNTRFERIWDQGGITRPSPQKFGYGSEIKNDHMKSAIRSAKSLGLPPQLIEPQSQMAPTSHGTHVASIAAGNLGICHKAYIAAVLISLPEADLDRRRSFYDSTRLAHAVEYLFDVAEELRNEQKLDELPISINISLGTNGHAHDASSAVSRWVDSALTIPGRSVCVAAGNAGQEAPETEEDLGYIMGRIHTSGRIHARGLDADIEWIIVGNGIEDISENELEIWYSPADRFSVSIKPPGKDWIEQINPGEYIENRQQDDGSFISIYNELYHPANGANYIAIYLSPYYSENMIKGITPGVWHVRLNGIEVRDGNYHGWIERDDPRRLGRIGVREVWRFPSFFSMGSNVDNSSVSSLACGHRVISVANIDEKEEKINITSSQGPTRDGRCKPDVAAPGTDIIAAKGFILENNNEWISMSGTSMASPYVAGIIGLMLAKNPRLTAAQIGGIIQRTADPLPGSDYTWRNDAGYGKLNPQMCLQEVDLLKMRKDKT